MEQKFWAWVFWFVLSVISQGSLAESEDHGESQGRGEVSTPAPRESNSQPGRACHLPFLGQSAGCSAVRTSFSHLSGINEAKTFVINQRTNGEVANYQDALTACLEKGLTLPRPDESERLWGVLGCFIDGREMTRFCETPTARGGRTWWVLPDSFENPFRIRVGQAAGGHDGGYRSPMGSEAAAIVCTGYESGRASAQSRQIARCYAEVLSAAGREIQRRRWPLENLNNAAIRIAIGVAETELTPRESSFGSATQIGRSPVPAPRAPARMCDLGSAEVEAIKRVVAIKLNDARLRADSDRRAERERDAAQGTISVDSHSTDAIFQDFMGRIDTVRNQWNSGHRLNAVMQAIFFPGNLLDQGTSVAAPFVGARARVSHNPEAKTGPVAVLKQNRTVPAPPVVSPVASPIVPPPPPSIPAPQISAARRRANLLAAAIERPGPIQTAYPTSAFITERLSLPDANRGGALRRITIDAYVLPDGRALRFLGIGISPSDATYRTGSPARLVPMKFGKSFATSPIGRGRTDSKCWSWRGIESPALGTDRCADTTRCATFTRSSI